MRPRRDAHTPRHTTHAPTHTTHAPTHNTCTDAQRMHRETQHMHRHTTHSPTHSTCTDTQHIHRHTTHAPRHTTRPHPAAISQAFSSMICFGSHFSFSQVISVFMVALVATSRSHPYCAYLNPNNNLASVLHCWLPPWGHTSSCWGGRAAKPAGARSGVPS